ncbi:unnamed protein product [Auanema sp. JU1783]|nr:unnamed protein product [Auanema sp. JU1783]
MTDAKEEKQPKMIDHVRNLSDLLRERKEDEAKRLLQRVPDLLTSRDDTGRSTVHFAAVGGCLSILKYCVNSDEDAVNLKDDYGWNPLMIATSAGRRELVQYLLSLPEIDVNQKNVNGQACLHYACSKNFKEIAASLLESGAYVNAADKYGDTPLHRAASQGHDQIVHLLISQKNINIDVQNGEGNTPLFMACEEEREDTALALAFKGANIEAQNKNEKTPLDVVKTSSFRTKLKNAAEKAAAMEH